MAPTDRKISRAELSKHNTTKDCWLAINGAVVEVTNYADEHPGGSEVLMEAAGGDATDMFEDIGHSEEARTVMKQYQIGVLHLTEEEKAEAAAAQEKREAEKTSVGGGLNPAAVVVVLVAIAVALYFTMVKK